VGNEVDVFEAAWRAELAIMIKGPTGCGKTRLVEHMANRLDVPIYTVSCHEDITTADLVGRYVLVGGETVWIDGPLTRAVREGGICYLDEIVEARQDSTVAIHPLADFRRELTIERQGGLRVPAAEGFCLVISYNPGYQSVLKDLKVSTRQRLVSIEMGFPPPEIERAVVIHEAGVDEALADDLIRLGQAIRRLEDSDSGLREVASTRTLIAAGKLVTHGLSPREAAVAAIAGPLTDDLVLRDGLVSMVESYLTV
jgi:nitric oxide reductase NorQ protein